MAIQPTDIEEYQKIVMQEPAQPWESALATYNEYFDPELQLARDTLNAQVDKDERDFRLKQDAQAIAQNQADSTAKYEDATLKLKEEELKRNDFIEFGSKMPPQAQLAYAKANNMPPDMIEYATNLNASWNKFQQDYRILKANPNSSADDWKEFKDRNISNFSMFKNFDSKLESNVNAEHQGKVNKDLLVSMIDSSPNFVQQMGKLGIDVSKWKDLDPIQASATLKQLPSYISTGMTSRKLDIADEELTQNMLTEMLKYSTAAFQSGVQYDPAQANEFLGSMNTIMNEMFTKRGITKDLGLGEDDDTTVTLTSEEMQAAVEREGRTGTLISTKGAEEPFEFEKGSDYRVRITDATGKTSTRTVKGGNAASIQKQKGWSISKVDKIIEPFKRGISQLDSGAIIKDTKTGKTLTFVGFDFRPEGETTTVSGKKIKRTRGLPGPLAAPRTALAYMTGGQKVLYFKDENGKSVIYTPTEAMRRTFIEAKEGVQSTEPAVRVADKPKEETKIPFSPSGSVAASGMEGRGVSEEDTVQQAIDAYLEEDASLQEIEDNE